MEITISFTTTDGEVLDQFIVWDPDRPEFTPVQMSQRVRDYIERRYEVKDKE